MEIVFTVNPSVTNDELNALFATAWDGHRVRDFRPILKHSLAYVCAYAGEKLIGFVNLAWDGDSHAFILDTTVHQDWQKRGIGRQLVLKAKEVAAQHKIEWLHVDYEPHLASFYQACGFQPTQAGLINLYE